MNLQNKNKDIKHLKISTVKTDRETQRSFLYTATDPSEGLIASIRENDVITPVVVSDKMQLVCGVRRLKACRILHMEKIPAFVTDNPVKAFLQGLWENLTFRSFSTLELGEIMLRLQNTADLREEKIISDYLPALGLSPSKKLYKKYLKAAALPCRIKKTITDGSLKKSHIFLLTRFEPHDAEELSEVFAQLNPSSGEARILTELLTDLTQKNSSTFSETIKSSGIQTILKSRRAPKHKIRHLRKHLREAVLPTLTKRREEIKKLAGKLSLDEIMQVNLPQDLSKLQIEIIMRIKNPSDYTRAVSTLNCEPSRKNITQILNLLRGDRSEP